MAPSRTSSCIVDFLPRNKNKPKTNFLPGNKPKTMFLWHVQTDWRILPHIGATTASLSQPDFSFVNLYEQGKERWKRRGWQCQRWKRRGWQCLRIKRRGKRAMMVSVDAGHSGVRWRRWRSTRKCPRILVWQRKSSSVNLQWKLQAVVYGVLPPTTAI